MKLPAAMARASGLAALIALGSATASLSLNPQGMAPLRLEDNSDWWSISNAVSSQKATPQKRKIPDKNLEIMSVVLGEDMFSLAATEFGSVRPVIRGGTANFREQACYALPATEYLILEHGEARDTFYLFVDGAPWKGQDSCVPSARAPLSIMTASGLHVGQTAEQVIATLGQPSERTPEQLLYVFALKRPATAEELAQLQKQQPEASKPQSHRVVEIDVTVTIVAKFVRSELNYLAVSKAEGAQPEAKKQ